MKKVRNDMDTETKKTRNDVPPPVEHVIRGLGTAFSNKAYAADIKKIAGLSAVEKENLSFQIRGRYLNVYFMGGSMWKVEFPSRPEFTKVSTDEKYFERKDNDNVDNRWLPKPNAGLDKWLACREKLESVMEEWFELHPKAERKLQHECSCNHLINTSSQWIVIDIEYAAWLHGMKAKKKDLNSRRLCKFDMVAIPRSSLSNNTTPLPVYLVEFKVGGKSVSGASGLKSHAEDFEQFLNYKEDKKSREAFVESMRNIIREKIALGLLPGVPEGVENRKFEMKPMFVLKDVKSDSYKNRAEAILQGLTDKNLWMDYDTFIS